MAVTTELEGARAAPPLPAWNFWRQTLRATLLLAGREARLALRTPAYLIPNLIVPIFFYFVTAGSLKGFASEWGFENWEGFVLPMAIIFAVQGGSAGLNMVADIESGYFDKLLLTPANRMALLIGAMGADFIRIMLQAAFVVLVAVGTGVTFATGVGGAAAMIFMASLFGLAYSGIGFALALKTGNAQATQSMWFLFMPFMFLTTLFAPKESMTGWLRTAATFNPVTYILEGMRAFSLGGGSASDILYALAAIAAIGAVSLTAAFMALNARLR
jgi:ABC-2 type transport system permease protein